MSLRARLLIGLVALATVGLVTVGTVTYTQQRRFLLQRIDQEASAATPKIANHFGGLDGYPPPARGGPGALTGGPGGGPRDEHDQPLSLPTSTVTERLDAHGNVLGSYIPSGPTLAAPKLPKSIPVSDHDHIRPITVDSVGDSGLHYRVIAFTAGDQQGTTVIAIPLREIDDTLNSLLEIEGLVGGGVLLALIGLAWWMIRIGLRPLDRMGATADAIAAGDLSRRVEDVTPRTEVGRLGLALNGMLQQIERAFAEREASADRLRRFLADASHELRTPLASIRGYAELFRIGAVTTPEDTAKALSRIEAEAARMGVLVEDLLTLARLDEMPEPRRGRVDLSALARDAVADSLAIAADREISLDAEASALVLGDPHQLRQVIANLMRNAVVHTPPGTPIEVTVGIVEHDPTIRVRDHGPGLPADANDTIFERFWRADPGRGRGKAGAGLGLSIVAAIVKAHGGRATAANAPDGGAIFTVRLPPFAAGPDDAQTEASAADTSAEKARP